MDHQEFAKNACKHMTWLDKKEYTVNDLLRLQHGLCQRSTHLMDDVRDAAERLWSEHVEKQGMTFVNEFHEELEYLHFVEDYFQQLMKQLLERVTIDDVYSWERPPRKKTKEMKKQ